jgi:hypothetical protein
MGLRASSSDRRAFGGAAVVGGCVGHGHLGDVVGDPSTAVCTSANRPMLVRHGASTAAESYDQPLTEWGGRTLFCFDWGLLRLVAPLSGPPRAGCVPARLVVLDGFCGTDGGAAHQASQAFAVTAPIDNVVELGRAGAGRRHGPPPEEGAAPGLREHGWERRATAGHGAVNGRGGRDRGGSPTSLDASLVVLRGTRRSGFSGVRGLVPRQRLERRPATMRGRAGARGNPSRTRRPESRRLRMGPRADWRGL